MALLNSQTKLKTLCTYSTTHSLTLQKLVNVMTAAALCAQWHTMQFEGLLLLALYMLRMNGQSAI